MTERAAHEASGLEVFWSGDRSEGSLQVQRDGRTVFETVPGSFLAAGIGRETIRESRGHYRIGGRRDKTTTVAALEFLTSTREGVEARGRLGGEEKIPWSLSFEAVDELQIRFVLKLEEESPDERRLWLQIALNPSDKIFGFGAQMSRLDMRGRKVLILSQEPGIGRGIQPLTGVMDLLFKAGGAETQTGCPSAHFLTSSLRSLALENHEISEFDMRTPGRVEILVHSGRIEGRIYCAASPLKSIEGHARFSGRMPEPPPWIDAGAIIGVQGGTERVKKISRDLAEKGAAVAALWLQDWCGARKTAIGSQLWWNWELDRERYPDWEGFVSGLKEKGIRVLCYLNPFLVERDEKKSEQGLFQEAKTRGFFVRTRDGAAALVKNTSFSAAMLDLSQGDARRWFKETVKSRLLSIGASGWMADFGEALPFDGVLTEGKASSWHNRYPEEWAKLNREIVEESGRDDLFFFMRGGFTRSPGFCRLFWLGDHLTGWSREDGIKSALLGLLSSGFSGFSLNHSDAGGYTATTLPFFPFRIPGLFLKREKELLLRWVELNAFTAVLRTHEGNQPENNVQIYSDDETLSHFVRFSNVYRGLGAYRRGLFRDAAALGRPVVRHPWLHFANDPVVLDLEFQFMLGPDLMAAPVLDLGRRSVPIYLPEPGWEHVWTGKVFGAGWNEVEAPIGRPAVFARPGSGLGAVVRESVA